MQEGIVMNETKHDKFVRLATSRGNRVLRDLELLGNLSHRGNYEYSDEEVRKLFLQIEGMVKDTRARFTAPQSRKEINL